MAGELRGKLRLEERGVLVADAEGDQVTDVAEDGVDDARVRDLREELVGEDQADAELAGLGQQRDEALGGERLELVDVDVEQATLLLRQSLAREGRGNELAEQDHAEQSGSSARSGSPWRG